MILILRNFWFLILVEKIMWAGTLSIIFNGSLYTCVISMI